MIYDYPTIIVDGFFKDPLLVRELALTLPYKHSSEGVYSGKRTDSLHITHPNFFESVCKKILDCYSLPYSDYSALMHFHLTGSEFGNSGWVHTDAGRKGGSQLASIVYLNTDDNSIEYGTSLYKQINLDYGYENIRDMKSSFINSIDNTSSKIDHNKNYQVTTKVGNFFNRMVAYDACNHHAGTGYYGKDDTTSRLTLLTFFQNICAMDNSTPTRRAENYSNI